MSLISIDTALQGVLSGIAGPLDAERIALSAAAGRVLAEDLTALRDQPPFAASAMDGYAVRSTDAGQTPVSLRVVGVSAAGRRFPGVVKTGDAVRIFTGAPLPDGTDAIVIQENTESRDDVVLIKQAAVPNRHIRPAALDFKAGEILLKAGQVIVARDIALAVAMGHATALVHRKPRIAVLATGDELVPAGEVPGPDQIPASSLPALLAMVEKAGGQAIDLGIARDTLSSLNEKIEVAKAAGVDVLVTLGGASVGEHDLVQEALSRQGMTLGFWRVALRPGKPLMHGKLGAMNLLGLPGNPVSSVVCAILFLVPAIHALQGRTDPGGDPTETVTLGQDLPANGDRQDYMRASLTIDSDDSRITYVTAHRVQDSSMLDVLAKSDALLVRPPHAPALTAGNPCKIIRLAQYC